MVDDTGFFLEVARSSFSASEIGLESFGWNIPLEILVATLREVAQNRGVEFIDGKIQTVALLQEAGYLSLADGQALQGKLIVATEARNSAVRKSAGIACERWAYDQSALATSFSHSVAHQDTSTEYLSRSGPLTTIPLPGLRSSLVWMERPHRVDELMSLTSEKFARELQAAMHGELGLINEVGPRSVFPMSGLRAADLGSKRVVLAGGAAYVMPPVGAQGLNIGLRDAATIAELVLDWVRAGGDIGSDELIRLYAKMRWPDVALRQSLVHHFNQSLLSDFLPLDFARAAGLALLDRIAPLRRYVMQHGLQPSFNLPRIMHP
jgi:2-octaprenyl-6-methoxyphenol hydroxylase